MERILESGDHHFLTTLETFKQDHKEWLLLRLDFSEHISHSHIIRTPAQIKATLAAIKARGMEYVEDLYAALKEIEGFIYLFHDTDIIVLAKPKNDAEKRAIHVVFKQAVAAHKLRNTECTYLASVLYEYQKMADLKLLVSARFEAYTAMADQNKVSSIPVRRARRERPVVLLVEDDRFTSAYAANILGKEYELVHCKNGEESIAQYIEAAPDIVLLDIHLPGLTGHQTLEAIKAIDSEAFVVMLSVDTVMDSILRASEIGAQSFLKKPFSKERLINTVEKSPYISGLPMETSSAVH